MFNKQSVHIVCAIALLMLTKLSIAAPPLSFSANYDARYQGLNARATISLLHQGGNVFIAQTDISIRLFGARVSSIREASLFNWANDMPQPIYYEYVQSGIGGRSRSLEFNWDQQSALAKVDDDTIELQLLPGTVDEISMYTLIKQELLKGSTEISFPVIDQNILEEYHYRVLGEEEIVTSAGIYTAIKVERIRENSERVTQIWFAKNHDMLMVKLYQRDPDGDEFEITLSDAIVNGLPVSTDSV